MEGELQSLNNHACATFYAGGVSECCWFDASTGLCSVFWDQGFLYPCDTQCNEPESYYKEPHDKGDVDCGTCTDYYPNDSLGTPKNDYGELSSLTGHACGYNGDVSGCCLYDRNSGLCGVYWIGEFLYPCGPSCQSSTRGKKSIMIISLTSVFSVLALAIYGFLLRKKMNSNAKRKDGNNNVLGGEEDQIIARVPSEGIDTIY